MREEVLTVDGFVFASEDEAKAAQADIQRISRLEEKLNYDNLDAVAMVYVKSIQNTLFHTVIGDFYLKRLQQYLIRENYEKIDFQKFPIPVRNGANKTENVAEEQAGVKDGISGSAGIKIRTNYQQELKRKLRTSRCVNVILALFVIALFVIALTGENANILNYRYNIQNEYSEWQKQLQEREASVLEREQALEQSE